MWMRSCAVCKALLRKLRLSDSVRCQCGWEWAGYAQMTASGTPAQYETTKETNELKDRDELWGR